MRLTIKLKLAGAFGAVLVLTMAVGGVAYNKLSIMNDAMDNILSQRVKSLRSSDDISVAALNAVRFEKNTIISADDKERNQFGREAADYHSQALDLLNERLAHAAPETRPFFTKVAETLGALWAKEQEAIRFAQTNSQAQAHDLAFQQGKAAFENARSAVAILANDVSQDRGAVNADGGALPKAISNAGMLLSDVWSDSLLHLSDSSLEAIESNDKKLSAAVEAFQTQTSAIRSLVKGSSHDELAVELSKSATRFAATETALIARIKEASNLHAIDMSAGPGSLKIKDEFFKSLKELRMFVATKLDEDQTLSIETYNQATARNPD